MNSLRGLDLNCISAHCHIIELCPKGGSQIFYRHVCTNFYNPIILILYYNHPIYMYVIMNII